jgi:hypothetical protein
VMVQIAVSTTNQPFSPIRSAAISQDRRIVQRKSEDG